MTSDPFHFTTYDSMILFSVILVFPTVNTQFNNPSPKSKGAFQFPTYIVVLLSDKYFSTLVSLFDLHGHYNFIYEN